MTIRGGETRKIDNDGVALALTVAGDGPDLLFVHGLGSAQVLWHPLVEVLSDRYRCWLLDLRGHGVSARVPGGYTSAGYASDVAAALDHIGSATIGIGHSLGGRCLARIGAARHPQLVGAFLIDSSILRQTTGDRPAGLVRVFGAQLDMLRRFQPEQRPVDDYEVVLGAAPYVAGGTNADHMTAAQLRGRAESLSQLDPECFAAAIDGPSSPDFVAPAMDIPLRIIAADAELGASFRPEDHDELAEFSPQATFRRLPGVGHQTLMIRGYDDTIREDLEEWLRTQDAFST